MGTVRSRGPAVLAAVLLIALAGCTPGGSTSGAAAATGGPAPTNAALAPVPSATTAASAAGPAATPSAAIQMVSGDTWLFATPSGNIDCALSATDVRCDIGDRIWSAPPRPQDCQLDYGNGVVVSASGAGLSCAGDTLLHATTTVLAYGHGARDGDVLCVSQQTDVWCQYVPTGHGFTLAREGYTLF